MANKTIAELSPLTPSSTSLFAMYENGGTGKASIQQVLNTTIPGLTSENGVSVKTAVNNLASTVGNLVNVEFTSNDELNPSSTTSVELLTGNENWSDKLLKISKMFKNIRYLLKMLGTTDISSLSQEGTVTGALNNLNDVKQYISTLAIPGTNTSTTTNHYDINNAKSIITVIWKAGTNGAGGIDILFITNQTLTKATIYSSSTTNIPTYTYNSSSNTITITNNDPSYLRGHVINR